MIEDDWNRIRAAGCFVDEVDIKILNVSGVVLISDALIS